MSHGLLEVDGRCLSVVDDREEKENGLGLNYGEKISFIGPYISFNNKYFCLKMSRQSD